MIDIIRDYTAIGMGTAQATTNRIVGLGRAGAAQAVSWGVGTLADVQQDPVGTVTQAPGALAARVHGELDRVVGRVGYVSGEEVRALRLQVQKMERRIAELRGDL